MDYELNTCLQNSYRMIFKIIAVFCGLVIVVGALAWNRYLKDLFYIGDESAAATIQQKTLCSYSHMYICRLCG